MDGLPVTIRLLDPPLHEFLPHDDKGQEEVAKSLGVSPEKVKERVDELHEFNPMMGFRGCRLPIVFPEIGDMQVRAIIEAAIEVKKKGKNGAARDHDPARRRGRGTDHPQEAGHRRRRGVHEEGRREGRVPDRHDDRAAARLRSTADKIAEEAEFFCFGTNDLTQMTFGFSRDDIKGFMPTYLKEKILPVDPFQSIDVNGVGQLIEIGIKKGRDSRKAKHDQHLKVGICGEHGGDPDSVVLLPQGRHGLRELLAVPRADRAPGGGAGGTGRHAARQVREIARAAPGITI